MNRTRRNAARRRRQNRTTWMAPRVALVVKDLRGSIEAAAWAIPVFGSDRRGLPSFFLGYRETEPHGARPLPGRWVFGVLGDLPTEIKVKTSHGFCGPGTPRLMLFYCSQLSNIDYIRMGQKR